MKDLKRKTYKAFAWDFFGKLSNQGVGFIVSIFLARLLLPKEFGIVAMAMVIISITHVLTDMGLGVALVQKSELNDKHYGSVFYFNIIVGSFLTIIFFLLSSVIANFYAIKSIEPIFKALSFSFFINSFANVQRSWLTKHLKFNTLTKSNIIAGILSGTVGIILAYKGFGVWALVYQTLLAGIIGNLYIYLFTGWRPKLLFSLNALKDLWGFGFRMFLSGMLNTITSQLDNLIIGKIFSPATLGYYNRAKSFNQFVIRYTSGSLMAVFLPTLSAVKDDNERFNSIVYKSFHILNLVTFFILGLLFLTIKDLVIILFTIKWLPSVIFFKILLLAGYGYPFSSLLVNIIASKGNSKNFFKLELIKQSMFLLNLFFGFLLGIKGYLYINAVVVFVAFYFNIVYASKEINVKVLWFYKIIFPYFISSILITFIVYLINNFFIIENIYLHFLFILSLYSILSLLLGFLFKFKGLRLLIEELKTIYERR